MVTMPVPTLISQLFWYCASRPPESAVRALEMHRPTVMVNAGLMVEARTISGVVAGGADGKAQPGAQKAQHQQRAGHDSDDRRQQ